VIVYASLGALFLPFLAITLLILLNSQRVAPEYRNRLVSSGARVRGFCAYLQG
jgi:hypothetical protein